MISPTVRELWLHIWIFLADLLSQPVVDGRGADRFAQIFRAEDFSWYAFVMGLISLALAIPGMIASVFGLDIDDGGAADLIDGTIGLIDGAYGDISGAMEEGAEMFRDLAWYARPTPHHHRNGR